MKTAYIGGGSGGSTGTFLPIQNVRFLDPSFAGTPNGSIAEPWTTFAQALTPWAGSTEPFQINLPGDLALVSGGAIVPALGAGGGAVFQGLGPAMTVIDTLGVAASPLASFPEINFRDLTINELNLEGGESLVLEFNNCFINDFGAIASGPFAFCFARLISSQLINMSLGVSDVTVEVFGGSLAGNCSWRDGRLYNTQVGTGTYLLGNAQTHFVGCLFGSGVTVDNTNTPILVMDAFSYASFVASSVAFAGTVLLLSPSDTDQTENLSGVIGASCSDALNTLAAYIAAIPSGVPTTRLVSTTAPLTGGGDLSANRTLAISDVSNATSGAAPVISGSDRLLKSNAGGTAATWVTQSGTGSPVGSARSISTTAPLAGGGDLSANRTLTVADVSGSSKGVVPQISQSSSVLMSDAGGTFSTWTSCSPNGLPVGTGRVISTTAPLAGGGDLSNNLTLSVAAVSNASAGVAPIHAGAADVGKSLVATSTGSQWSSNVGSKFNANWGVVAAPGLATARYIPRTNTTVDSQVGRAEYPISLAGTFTFTLTWTVGTTTLSTDTVALTVMLDGVATGLTSTIPAAGATSGQASLSIAVTAMQKLSIRLLQSGTEAQANWNLGVNLRAA